MATASALVVVGDDDPPRVTVAPVDLARVTTLRDTVRPSGVGPPIFALALNESDDEGTEAKENEVSYTVVLASEPPDPVTVRVHIPHGHHTHDGQRHHGSPVTVAPATLEFTASDWDEAQTVTVTAVDDNVDNAGGVRTAELYSSASGGGYHRQNFTVEVQVRDDDVPAVTVAAGAAVTEGGDAVFTLTADPAPAADLAVGVTVAAAGEYGVAAGAHTVTIPTTGSATLTLATANNDHADEAHGSVTATVNAGDGYTVGTSGSATVAVKNDDTPIAQCASSLPGNAVSVSRVEGWRDVYKSRGNVELANLWDRVLAALDPSAGAGVPMSASEAQTYADQGGNRWKRTAATLRAIEGCLPAISIAAGPRVKEGDAATFTLTATRALPAPVTVNLTVTDAPRGDFLASDDEGARTMVFPAGETVMGFAVATVDDRVDEPDDDVTVKLVSGIGYRVATAAGHAAVAVWDDDARGVAVNPSSLTLWETDDAGTSDAKENEASYTVVLESEPTGPVTVTVTVPQDSPVTVDPATLEFTASDWSEAQTVTVTAVDDEVDNAGDVRTAVLSHDVSGGDYGSAEDFDVTVTVTAAPKPQQQPVTLPAVTTAAGTSPVTEGGDATFTVTASPAPAADLPVTVAVAIDGAYGITAGSQTVIIPTTGSAVLILTTTDDKADEPDGSVTATVQAGEGYTVGDPASGMVAVLDDDAAALPSLSVDDLTVTEGAYMEFTVRLSAPSAGGVAVKVSTRDSTPVSATARKDYWPLSGRTVSFRAGETERSVGVIVYDDNHDEEPETFEVVLSDARGAAIGDGVAVGTIVNDDPMPAAWLSRFGRTVAEQALDGIAVRLSVPRSPGMRGTLAGRALRFDAPPGGNAAPGHGAAGSPAFGGPGSPALADFARSFGDRSERFGTGGFGSGFDGTQSQSMTAREALLGSSFSLTGEADGSGGSMAFWGRASEGSFDGREGTFSLDGAVTTGMLGADYARGKWLVGLALAQSEGEGDYRDTGVNPRPDGQTCPDGTGPLCDDAVRTGDGKVEASLTAAIPYAALRASERLKLWGAAGHGTGEVTLKTAMDVSYKADTSWSMAAMGMRGDLFAPPAEGSGPALTVTSDALWTRTSSEKTHDLAASDSDVTRLRLGLEGSWRMVLEGGGHLSPKLEVGARHDGGDAETGSGLDLGGGIAWNDPALGLSLDVSGRTLIAHGNDDLKNRGYAASLAFDPDPATGRGPSLSLRQEFGGQATGGLDALFQPATLEDRTGGEVASRWAMEAAYGFPAFGGRWTGSPHGGLGLTTAARVYSVGWRLTPEAASAPDLSFGLRATRRESDTDAPEHTVGFEVRARW